MDKVVDIGTLVCGVALIFCTGVVVPITELVGDGCVPPGVVPGLDADVTAAVGVEVADIVRVEAQPVKINRLARMIHKCEDFRFSTGSTICILMNLYPFSVKPPEQTSRTR